MSKTYHFNLHPSEKAIFTAAANIYAAYVTTNQVTPENNPEMMKKAITAALTIARHVENIVQSDEELPPNTDLSPSIKPF